MVVVVVVVMAVVVVVVVLVVLVVMVMVVVDPLVVCRFTSGGTNGVHAALAVPHGFQ